MKKLLQLYWIFFKLGIVNFGGGYALLPLLQKELVENYKWATDEEVIDYYAIGQCTPGAIAVNVSTFIGYKVKGVLGGIAATLGFISPAFLIIFVIATILSNFSDIPQVQSAFKAIRVCVFVLILSAILKLRKKSVFDIVTIILAGLVFVLSTFTNIPLFIFVIIAGIIGITYNLIKQKMLIKNEETIKKEEK
jgi:chromate transporter